MADGVSENLTTYGPVADHHISGSLCQDCESSTKRGQHTTFFYDCIEQGQDSHPDATSLRHTGLWVVLDNGDEDFNESACVSSPKFSEDYPINRTDPFPSFQSSTKFHDTASRGAVWSHSATHVITEDNANCFEKNHSQNNFMTSKAQNRETFSNHLQELNDEENRQHIRFLNVERTDCRSLNSIAKLVSFKFDSLTIDSSVTKTRNNEEGILTLTRNRLKENLRECIDAPKSFNVPLDHQPLHSASETFENQNALREFQIHVADEVVSNVHKEGSVVLVKRCQHYRQGDESMSKSVEFSDGKIECESRDTKFLGRRVKDQERRWCVVDGDTKVMEADEQIYSKEKSLNFNSNADVPVRESSGESTSCNLSELRLQRKLRKLRRIKEELLFYVNILLAWNLIQMLVLFGTLFYAFVCICHFRQTFGCDKMCLLRPERFRRNDVPRKWWD